MVQVLNKSGMLLLYDDIPCICFSNKLNVRMTCVMLAYVHVALMSYSVHTRHTAHCILY